MSPEFAEVDQFPLDRVEREAYSVKTPLNMGRGGELPSVFRAAPQSSLVPFCQFNLDF